jgi:hypothetical protein
MYKLLYIPSWRQQCYLPHNPLFLSANIQKSKEGQQIETKNR